MQEGSFLWITVIIAGVLCGVPAVLLTMKRGRAYGLSLLPALIAVATFWVFIGIVMLWTGSPRLDALDSWLDSHVTSIGSGGLLTAMRAVTYLGSGWIAFPMALGAAFILYKRGALRTIAALFVTFLVGETLVQILKLAFNRPRPAVIQVHEIGSSFPSGHAFTATVVYGFIIYFLWHRRIRPVWLWTAGLVFIILLVGFSRIYLHAHFLTDVMGGFVLGLGCLMAGIVIIWLAPVDR